METVINARSNRAPRCTRPRDRAHVLNIAIHLHMASIRSLHKIGSIYLQPRLAVGFTTCKNDSQLNARECVGYKNAVDNVTWRVTTKNREITYHWSKLTKMKTHRSFKRWKKNKIVQTINNVCCRHNNVR